MKENLTMVEKCFVCGKEQKVGEPYTTYDLKESHISFCSDKCQKIHSKYGKNMIEYGKRLALKLAREETAREIFDEIKRVGHFDYQERYDVTSIYFPSGSWKELKNKFIKSKQEEKR